MRLVLLGPPGAGKGTQAQLIRNRMRIPHISTGDLLRTAVASKTELGIAAEQFMGSGNLVPDNLVVGMIERRITAGDCDGGFVLDGFPRNVTQAEVLDQMLQKLDVQLDHVISLRVPREKLVERLSGRRTCRECGAMFHLRFAPPARAEVCDRCGGQLVPRDDDREETIRARLDVYGRETAPLCEYYQSRGLLRPVDAVGQKEHIFERILEQIDGR